MRGNRDMLWARTVHRQEERIARHSARRWWVWLGMSLFWPISWTIRDLGRGRHVVDPRPWVVVLTEMGVVLIVIFPAFAAGVAFQRQRGQHESEATGQMVVEPAKLLQEGSEVRSDIITQSGHLGRIVIRRSRGTRDLFRRYKIYLDNVCVGTVKAGRSIEIQASGGIHQLRAKIDWASSDEITFEVRDGEEVLFYCHSGRGSAMKGLRDPGSYIVLAREDGE